MSDVNDLQKNLKQLQLEQILGVGTKNDIIEEYSGLLNRVMETIERCKQQQKEQKGKEAPNPLTYELYCTKDANFQKVDGLVSTNKLASLEARLACLEKVTGSDSDRNSIVQDAKSKNLLESVDNLEQRLSLLDNNQLDLIDARLSIVLHKLSQVKDKKSNLNAEQNGKVDELYEMMRKWDALCSSLPQIVSRLQSLKDLHEQALQFSQSVTYLDGVQQELNKTLESDVSVLNEMKEAFAKNMDSFKNNCESVEKRLKYLNK